MNGGMHLENRADGQTVLIVGIGTSGIDIAQDLSPQVKKIYMVGKNEIVGPEGYQMMRSRSRIPSPRRGWTRA
jgi:cation diffusion facilitator CzcD-associated flavoprotein CzcO